MKLICTKCPRGCELTYENNIVTGNFCPIGVDYAVEEATNPTRTITAFVSTNDGIVPVKSSKNVNKSDVFKVLDHLKTFYIESTYVGQVIIENCLGLGVDIVVTGHPYKSSN